MRLRSLLCDTAVRMVATVVGYLVLSLAALAVVVWTALTAAQRADLGEALRDQVATLVLGGLLVLAGLVVLLLRGPGAYPVRARRLAADVRLLLGVNPQHRLAPRGPRELDQLALAVNELADRRLVAQTDVATQVSAARADVEQERNRLAALMADLDVAVLLCSRGGRVLLYNDAARSLLADDPGLGLGRSVFGVVDRDLITHALSRLADSEVPTHVSTTLREGQLLQVRVSPVRAAADEVSGFVLVLQDTEELQSRRRRDALLRSLTECTRSSAASIQAAAESLLDHPEMDAGEHRRFLEILQEEAHRLGGQLSAWSAETAELGGDGLLADMAGADLLTVLGGELERSTGLPVAVSGAPDQAWVRVDSHALARALAQLAGRLLEDIAVAEPTLSLTGVGRHARLELRWDGSTPPPEALRGWLDEPLPGSGACAREVVEQHDAEIWTGAESGRAHLRMLLPSAARAETGGSVRPSVRVLAGSRPEFYDFDLFDLPEEALAWQDRRLAELTYTVLDTETTGFLPQDGDEILAVGAVHVVGGRVRSHETFDRLVDPRRSIPEASTAVHGITAQMVQGQPPLEQVLPLFARFAEGQVLVGHNVGFDLSFVRAREQRTGVRLNQPALDTLLLDAVLHPDHDSHSLEAVAARLGVDVVGRHTALGDALVTGEVFVRLLVLLQDVGISTLGEALEASRETYQARLDARLYG